MDLAEEIPPPCSMCGKIPEGLLLLICGHNLCVFCAAANMKREEQKGSHSFKTVLCDLCETTTVLDPESIRELEEIDMPKERARLPQVAPASPPSPINNVPCEVHPDEAAKYFCFDCCVPPICSECVLGGIHTNHEVLHIKKAYPIIRGRAEDIIQQMFSRVSELEVFRNSLDSQKASLQSQSENIKSQIKAFIEEVIAKIVQKHKELDDFVDMLLDDTLKELDSMNKAVINKIEIISNNANYIRTQFEEDLHSALTFYAENSQILLADLKDKSILPEHFETTLQRSFIPITATSVEQFRQSVGVISEAVGDLTLGSGRQPNQLSAKTSASFSRGIKAPILKGYS